MGFPGDSAGKESACNEGDLDSILGWEDPLEKGTVTHSSIPVVHRVAKRIDFTGSIPGLPSVTNF